MSTVSPGTPEEQRSGAGSSNASHAARPEETRPTCGVRYGAMRWIGEFRLAPHINVKSGTKVVVQSDRGIELGEQASLTRPDHAQSVGQERIRAYIDQSGPEFYRFNAGRILREASSQDVDEHARLNGHVREDTARCKQIAAELNLDMKVVTAEHLLGGERIVFYFRSEGRVDFRELVRELARHYQTRIEMRQVGARDEARLIADYEVCGRECCCRDFLKKLRPVTMRMAKLQKSTLDPSKVSGRCGRLRCCLRYEHECYDELARRLPRVGARVETEFGSGTIIDRQVLTQLLQVRIDDDRVLTIPFEEVSPAGTPLPMSKKAAAEPVATSDATETDAPPEPGEKQRPRRRRRGRSRRRPADESSAAKADDAAGSKTGPEARSPSDREAPATNAEKPKENTRPRRRRGRRRRRPQ